MFELPNIDILKCTKKIQCSHMCQENPMFSHVKENPMFSHVLEAVMCANMRLKLIWWFDKFFGRFFYFASTV